MNRRPTKKIKRTVEAATELFTFFEHMICECINANQGIRGTLYIPYHVVMQQPYGKYPGVKLKAKFTIEWDGDVDDDHKAGKIS